jgi:hypothetical protein
MWPTASPGEFVTLAEKQYRPEKGDDPENWMGARSAEVSPRCAKPTYREATADIEQLLRRLGSNKLFGMLRVEMDMARVHFQQPLCA